MYRRIRYLRDYRLYALVAEISGNSDPLLLVAHLTWVTLNNLLPRRWQIEPDDTDREYMKLLAVPIHRLHARAEAAKRQAQLLSEPKLDKKARRETYKFVNKAMQPLLKLRGFRSLAELERAREEIGDECSG